MTSECARTNLLASSSPGNSIRHLEKWENVNSRECTVRLQTFLGPSWSQAQNKNSLPNKHLCHTPDDLALSTFKKAPHTLLLFICSIYLCKWRNALPQARSSNLLRFYNNKTLLFWNVYCTCLLFKALSTYKLIWSWPQPKGTDSIISLIFVDKVNRGRKVN